MATKDKRFPTLEALDELLAGEPTSDVRQNIARIEIDGLRFLFQENRNGRFAFEAFWCWHAARLRDPLPDWIRDYLADVAMNLPKADKPHEILRVLAFTKVSKENDAGHGGGDGSLKRMKTAQRRLAIAASLDNIIRCQVSKGECTVDEAVEYLAENYEVAALTVRDIAFSFGISLRRPRHDKRKKVKTKSVS